jgi:hypothetical protein
MVLVVFWAVCSGKIRENALIKYDMPRDDDTAGLEVETPIAFVFAWVAKKDAAGRAGCKFVRGAGVEIGKAQATKNAEMIIGRLDVVKAEVWCLMVYSTRWADVKEIGGGVKGLDPKGRGEGGLEQEGANNVVGGANEAFGFTILRASVWARKAKADAMLSEVVTESVCKEFATIVAL